MCVLVDTLLYIYDRVNEKPSSANWEPNKRMGVESSSWHNKHFHDATTHTHTRNKFIYNCYYDLARDDFHS